MDAILLILMLAVAFISGSLILLGESLRCTLIMLTGIWSITVHERTIAGALPHYEFGSGKLEQAGLLCIALMSAIAGLWVANRAFGLALSNTVQTTPFGLALAATVMVLHTIRCGLLALPVPAAAARQTAPSTVNPSNERLRSLALVLVLQIAMTVAAVARDPLIALWSEVLGSVFVGLLMTAAGVKIGWRAILDLVDYALDPRSVEELKQFLFKQGVTSVELVDVRSRRSGRHVFVELTLSPEEKRSFEGLRQRLVHIRLALAYKFDGFDIAIRLET